MRIATRLLAVLLVLFVGATIALAILLPRIAEDPAMHRRIEQASTDAFGRPLTYESLDVGLFPPRIDLTSPLIPGGEPDAPPLLDAKRVELRLALWPLLALNVVIDSLVIEAPNVVVTLTPEGLDLPLAGEISAEPEPTAADGAPPSESLLELGIRTLRVRDARLALIDATMSPAVTLGLEGVSLTAHGQGVDDPIEMEARGRLVTGGRVGVRGTTHLQATDADLTVSLEAVALEAFAAYLDGADALDATLSGEVTLRGDLAAPAGVGVDLTVDARRVLYVDTLVEGPTTVRADLSGGWEALGGTFSIDATPVRIALEDTFEKPAGTQASVSGRLATEKDGRTRLTLDRLVLASLQATGEVLSGETTRITLDAAPFPAGGVVALSPAAAGRDVAGTLSIRGLTIRSEPLEVRGEIRLDDLRVALEGGGAVALSGRLVGRGPAIDLLDGRVEAGGQRVAVTGAVRELAGEQPFTLRFETPEVLRADALLTGLAPSLADSVYGPMTLRGDFTGRAAAEGDADAALDSVAGEFRLDMGDVVGDGTEGGRIVGFSLLGAVFEGLEELGHLARLTSLLLGGKAPDLSKYTGDRFQNLQVGFRVKDGILRTERARIVYRGYSANLQGTVDLGEGMALDMQGELALSSEVAALLGARAKDGEIVIPVAHVGGSVDEPEIGVSKKALTSLTAQIVSHNVAIGGVLGEAEKVVPGAGKLLGQGLDAILGGRADPGRAGKGGRTGGASQAAPSAGAPTNPPPPTAAGAPAPPAPPSAAGTAAPSGPPAAAGAAGGGEGAEGAGSADASPGTEAGAAAPNEGSPTP